VKKGIGGGVFICVMGPKKTRGKYSRRGVYDLALWI